MGYWSASQNEDPEKDLWGDPVADIVDAGLSDLVTKIDAQFLADVGRLPTNAEITMGIVYSLRAMSEIIPSAREAAVHV